jgi:hypothetical protein
MRTSRARLGGVAAIAALLAALLDLGRAAPAQASSGISQHNGFDACSAPDIGQMSAFWNNTPFWNIGIYIGGTLRGCGQPNLTSSWLQQTHAMGWQFLPIWVGPQAPCTGFRATFSWDPGTAYQQGRSEALAAYRAAQGLGMDTLDMPIIYDLEYFNSGDGGCVAAARQFVQGWVDQLHVPDAQRAGLYTNACILPNFATISGPPDFVWGAAWNGNPSTSDLPCVASGNWVAHQRHKQYAGGHNETWNGVTLNIDSDCSDAPVYPGPDSLGGTDGCAPGVPAVTDAALVTSKFGWVVRGDRLLVTEDGGRTFREAAADVRAAQFLDSRRGWVVSVGPDAIIVWQSSDGGRTWQAVATVPVAAPIVDVALAFGSGQHAELLAKRVTSSNFSLADRYSTDNGGISWQRTEVGWPRATAARSSLVDGANGWQVSAEGQCASGKTRCVTTTTLRATDDGGSTWRTILK